MSIYELKELECEYCKKNGLRVRTKIETEIVMGDRPKENIYWYVRCDYCKKLNKVLWETI